MNGNNVKTETITINGEAITAEPGKLLIHVCRENGIDVPTLCHDDRLAPYGGCRLCVVYRHDGRPGLIAACSTPVQPGMKIETDSDVVIKARRRQLQLLALNHRMECPVCERRGDCRFQDLIFRYGTPEEGLPFDLVRGRRDELSPVISRDPEKCILCGRCVRLCDEVQGVAAIGVMNRGLQSKIGTVFDRTLDCEFCGQCVNACPVGALVARPHEGRAPVYLRSVETTTCGYCSCGCQLRCEVWDNRIERVSSDERSIPNTGRLCVKGWLGQDVQNCGDRLTRPLVRKNGELVETTWEEALSTAAAALARAREVGGAVVGLGSARMTTEDAFQMQHFVRSIVGSPHVGVGLSGGRDALVEGVAPVTGRPASSATFDDLAAADVVVVLRADPSRTHPLVKTELVQGIRKRGQRVVLANGVAGGLSQLATDDLRLTPGSEPVFLAGLANRLLATGAETPVGFEAWAQSIGAYTPENVRAATGIDAAALDELAGAVAKAGSVVFVVVCGIGIPGDEALVSRSAATLAAYLAKDGERRTGVLVLGEKANTQGVLNAGLDPALLPGWRPAGDRSGWSALEALDRAAAGEVELIYLAGANPVGDWPDGGRTQKALANAHFVIANDAFLTPSAAMADLVFPVAILTERHGSFVSADGGTRTLRSVLQAPGRAPQDGQIFAELARRLGAEVPEGDALAEQLADILGDMAIGAVSVNAAPAPPAPQSVEEFFLDTSPQLFHSGTMTRHSAELCALAPPNALRMAPADVSRLGYAPGEEVAVGIDGTRYTLRVRVDRTVRPGTVATIFSNDDHNIRDLLDGPARPVSVELRRPE